MKKIFELTLDEAEHILKHYVPLNARISKMSKAFGGVDANWVVVEGSDFTYVNRDITLIRLDTSFAPQWVNELVSFVEKETGKEVTMVLRFDPKKLPQKSGRQK